MKFDKTINSIQQYYDLYDVFVVIYDIMYVSHR